MEIVGNTVMLLVSGALDAGLRDLLFWGSLAPSRLRSSPRSRSTGGLIARARAHAVVHAHHGHAH
jgi:hypothetical protein